MGRQDFEMGIRTPKGGRTVGENPSVKKERSTESIRWTCLNIGITAETHRNLVLLDDR